MTEPTLAELWEEAGHDGARYRELLAEHGKLKEPADPEQAQQSFNSFKQQKPRGQAWEKSMG